MNTREKLELIQSISDLAEDQIKSLEDSNDPFDMIKKLAIATMAMKKMQQIANMPADDEAQINRASLVDNPGTVQ